MNTFILIVGTVLVISVISYFFNFLNEKMRALEFKDWEIDDCIIVNDWVLKADLQKNNRKYAKLKGWNVNNIYIEIGDGLVYKQKWGILDVNKSASWRRNFKECELAMKKKPDFNGDFYDTTEIENNDNIDGKSILLLTEVECEAYLKIALDNEDYDLAEKIRKQMEKYR